MKQAVVTIVFCLSFMALPGAASAEKLPVIDGKRAIATVNDDPITLEEFNRTLAASHAERSEAEKAGRIAYSAIIKRLVNTRLIVLEAKNIGLNELPEVRNVVNQYSKETLMELLLEEHVKDITADEEEIQGAYEKIVREWKITSVRFDKEDAVKNFEEGIKAGNNFDETAKKAVEGGVAKEVEEGKYVKDTDLTLPMARLVSEMEVGSVSPIVSIGKRGFVIFKLEGVRLPEDEDTEARKRAKRETLTQKRLQVARDYYDDLKRRYVRINEELFEALDYESDQPGFDKLLQDERVLAEISGEKPITVGEFSTALKNKFYHGVERAIESKKINQRKNQVMGDILQRRILLKEALNQGIDKSEEYKNRVKEYEHSVIFGAFIRKVITPDIKLDLKELEAYYKKNSEEYVFPEMLRIKSLVFEKKGDAVNALDKLIKGTDFNWLSSHAEGQVDKNSEGLLKFEGRLLTVTSLPEDVRKSVSGAKPGDFRLYASSDRYFYVLNIYDWIPAKPQPFEDVKKEIAEKVFSDKVKKAVEDYADKLKEYYPVKIYAKDLQ